MDILSDIQHLSSSSSPFAPVLRIGPEQFSIFGITIITYCIFFWIADFDPENVIHEPVNRLVFVKHEEKFNNHAQVTGAKKLPCQGVNKVAIKIISYC